MTRSRESTTRCHSLAAAWAAMDPAELRARACQEANELGPEPPGTEASYGTRNAGAPSDAGDEIAAKTVVPGGRGEIIERPK